MVGGKRGLHARSQPRNALGWFASAPEVISIHSDSGDDLSSEVPVAPPRRVKVESSSRTPHNKGKMQVRSAFPLFT
jgi:hypothetical protein